MLSSLFNSLEGHVIIKTLTEQEKEIMRRKDILNFLTEEKSYSQLTVPSN